MKRKFILLPITLTATVAPITACAQPAEPEVAKFELTKQYEFSEEFWLHAGLRSEKRLDFEKDTTYIACVDMKHFPKPNESNFDLLFFVGADVNQSTSTLATITATTVKVDDAPLTRVYTREELGPMKYLIETNDGKTDVEVGRDTLGTTSKVEISFQIQQAVKQYYLVSQNLYVHPKSI